MAQTTPTPQAAIDHAVRVALEERIHELLVNRRWYRAHPQFDWADLREDNRVRLRELLRVRRNAKRARARKVRSEREFYAAALHLADWAPGELVESFGR